MPSNLPHHIDAQTYADQSAIIGQLIATAALSDADRETICREAADLVRAIRAHSSPGLMEVFLAEYGLSTDEGVALMCLAEALLRVPDAETIDALIEDKIAPSDWGRHLGRSSSSLVNASTWALMLTGKVLDDDAPGPANALRSAIKTRQKLRLSYRRTDNSLTTRTVRPLHMEYWGRVWTLTAWCEVRSDFRVFRIDLIETVAPLPELFVDEPGKTLADYSPTLPK